MWKSWGEQSKKERGEAKDGKVTSPPGGASGQRVGEMNKERVSGGFLDIKVRGAVRSQERAGCAKVCTTAFSSTRAEGASLVDLFVG